MEMNQTPSGERLHIGFFGRRNAGKSSLVNALTGQSLSIVSDIKGTTTDPVFKSMELLPLGPVVIMDTPGLDDEGELGLLRIKKARQLINRTDIGVIVADGTQGMGREELALAEQFQKKEIPYVLVYNKADLCQTSHSDSGPLWVSAAEGTGMEALKDRIISLKPQEDPNRRLVSDLILPGDTVILVTPIDKAAPKGRLILPQQQTIRDILDRNALALVCREDQLAHTLELLKEKPRLVITDSQVFPLADRVTPADIPLTSFSILFARYKGNLWQAAEGARALETVTEESRLLICEGCTHRRQCGDIGTCKLPAMIRTYTKKKPEFVFTSGRDFPDDVSGFHMIIHCGGCMLTEREMKYRLASAQDQGIPMTNYGIAIAYMNGILKRSLQPLLEAASRPPAYSDTP